MDILIVCHTGIVSDKDKKSRGLEGKDLGQRGGSSRCSVSLGIVCVCGGGGSDNLCNPKIEGQEEGDE